MQPLGPRRPGSFRGLARMASKSLELRCFGVAPEAKQGSWAGLKAAMVNTYIYVTYNM